ncbi:MAG: hypothetical protein OXD32_05590 [Endozoicomonadaceae bacterium]|nr:hypothetical protein [Endozoicomonadaceae bacterium]
MCRVLAAGDGKNKYSSSDREINVHNTAKNSKPCQPVTYTLSNPMEKSFSSSMERNDSLYDHNHRNSLSGILKYVFCITLSDD